MIPVGLAMVFMAGLIRGFSGFGFSVAAVPLLSLIMPPAAAVPVVLIQQMLVSLSGLRESARLCDWRSVGILAVGAAVATPLGTWALARLPAAGSRVCIAGIVLLAAGVLARGVRMKRPPSALGTLPFGLLCGLFNGLAGIPGPPIVAYYLAAPVGTAVARASMIVFFLASSLIALAPFAVLGLVRAWSAEAAVASFPLVWIGSMLGARLYRASPEAHYRTVALGILLVTAFLAAIRAGLGAV